jgi:trigger factor
VPKREVEVDQELVSSQLEALQGTVAELSPVESRTAQIGDVVVVDLRSAEYVTRDYVFELGDERLVDEIEAAVRGLLPGETREVRIGEGPNAIASVELKEIHEKVLPPLDDAFAAAATEFDTLAELRADLERRIREQLEDEEEGRFRQAAVDALVKATDVEPAPLVVDMRTRELLTSFIRSLESRGIDAGAYLQAAGVSGRELEQRLRAEATQSIARELVLEAVADRLGLEVTDDDIRAQLREQGESDVDIEEFVEKGGADRVRQDLRLKQAVDRIAAEVKTIAPELAEARESLWTPGKGEPGEKERPGAEKKLWTPGSK